MEAEKLGKNKKLKSFSAIKRLFDQGSSVSDYPIRILYRNITDIKTTLVGFSVSKRKYNRAVDRNGIKRKLREAYRKNQQELAGKNKYYLMLLYIGKEQTTSEVVNEKVKKLLNEISKKNV